MVLGKNGKILGVFPAVNEVFEPFICFTLYRVWCYLEMAGFSSA